jgi:hypothetical protein
MRRHTIAVKQAGRAAGLAAAHKTVWASIDRTAELRYARAVSIDARRSEGSLRAARRPRIELPPANSEQLRAPKLIAIGAASLAAGLVVALLLSSRTRAPAHAEPSADVSFEHASEQAPQPPKHTAAEVSATPADAGPREAPAVAIAAVQPPAAAAQPAAAASSTAPSAVLAPRDEHARVEEARAIAPPVVPTASEPAQPIAPAPSASAAPSEPPAEAIEPALDAPTDGQRVRVELGQVAYLRCDGLATKRGAFPCPRDRALEKSVRDVLTNIEGCRVAGELGRGRYEVRLELSATRAQPDLEVRAPSDAGERAVRACAGAALAKVTTRLRPQRMIVSQRFSVR